MALARQDGHAHPRRGHRHDRPLTARAAGGKRTIPRRCSSRERSGRKPFVISAGGACTYAEAPNLAARWAGSLAAAGVRQGDRVAVMAANRIEFLGALVRLRLARCGARPGQRRPSRGAAAPRARELRRAPARVDGERVAQLREQARHPNHARAVWILDADVPPTGIETSSPGPGEHVPAHPSAPGDTCAVLYTSGTTGAPKGVCCPHAQSFWWGVSVAELLGATPMTCSTRACRCSTPTRSTHHSMR